MKGQIYMGTYTGTGAAQNVKLGFIPDFVLVMNITDGTVAGFWFNGMAAGTSVDLQTALASNAADGITAYAGSPATDSAGFSVGTDYSTNAKVYRYLAIGAQ